MRTLMQLQISKRLKYIVGYLSLMLFLNILLTGVIELKNGTVAPYEGFYLCNGSTIFALLSIAVIDLLREQYSSQSRWIHLLPIKGSVRMTVKYIWIIVDVLVNTLINIFFSLMIRIIVLNSFDEGKIFITELINIIHENGLITIISVLLSFSIISFSVVCTQTLFYQNRTISLLSISFIMMIILAFISLTFKMIMTLLSKDQSVLYDSDISIIIPIFEGGQWNYVGIGILLVTFMICTTVSAKIMDRFLNF